MLEPGSPVVIGVMPGLRPAVVECASEIAELLGGRIYAVYADAGSYSPSEGRLAGVDPDSFGGDGGFPAELRSEIESLPGPAGQPRQPCGSSPSRDSRGSASEETVSGPGRARRRKRVLASTKTPRAMRAKKQCSATRRPFAGVVGHQRFVSKFRGGFVQQAHSYLRFSLLPERVAACGGTTAATARPLRRSYPSSRDTSPLCGR